MPISPNTTPIAPSVSAEVRLNADFFVDFFITAVIYIEMETTPLPYTRTRIHSESVKLERMCVALVPLTTEPRPSKNRPRLVEICCGLG